MSSIFVLYSQFYYSLDFFLPKTYWLYLSFQVLKNANIIWMNTIVLCCELFFFSLHFDLIDSLGFTTVGRVYFPQSDRIYIPIEHSGKEDSYFHKPI